MADIIERLGLGTEVRELKLGSSFMNDRSSTFHTLKYDFKPASVDDTKMATVDVGNSNTMTVTVPHLDGSGTSHTVFKGSQKPCTKECVLIIDHETGEITLERLSSNVQVKKTRLGMNNHSSSSSSIRPQTPNEMKKTSPIRAKTSPYPDVTQLKKSPPAEPVRSPTHSRTNSRTKVVSGKKKEPTFEVPGKKVPGRYSPHLPPNKKSSPILNNNTSPPMIQAPGSLPMIGLEDEFGLVPLTQAAPVVHKPRPIPPKSSPVPSKPQNSYSMQVMQTTISSTNSCSMLSDSSSSSSSSSSDSSDSSDNESDAPPPAPAPRPSNERMPIMPNNLLNDDLKLSESESDSD